MFFGKGSLKRLRMRVVNTRILSWRNESASLLTISRSNSRVCGKNLRKSSRKTERLLRELSRKPFIPGNFRDFIRIFYILCYFSRLFPLYSQEKDRKLEKMLKIYDFIELKHLECKKEVIISSSFEHAIKRFSQFS